MGYKQEAKELIKNLQGRMGPSPYDIAWLARIKTSSNGEARWPDLIEWLVVNQRADGSWGSQVVYYHERIICTLAAAIALRQNARNHHVGNAVKRAESYLWNHLHLLRRDPFELVGFELLLPTLLLEAQSLGLDVPSHAYGYGEIQTAKLRLIPPDFLYSPRVTTVHSLEFLGHSGDPERLRAAIGRNGSLGNSPAATAYYLLACPDDERALTYLETMQQECHHAICLYPFRTFELVWALNSLTHCGLPIVEFAEPDVWQTLQADANPSGLGLDPAFGIADADNTSVGARLLIEAGREFDPLMLLRFEDKKTHLFRTYDYERNISIGTNIHAFETLALLPDYPDRDQVQEAILSDLLKSRIFNIYWIDKWHASPYYATAHALIAVLKAGRYLTQTYSPTIDWLVHTQRDDGSWGFYEESTAEETAYALTALLHFQRYHPLVNTGCLHRAADYLARTYDGTDSIYPALWIGKCLYAPTDMIRAAILSALILYKETFN